MTTSPTPPLVFIQPRTVQTSNGTGSHRRFATCEGCGALIDVGVRSKAPEIHRKWHALLRQTEAKAATGGELIG